MKRKKKKKRRVLVACFLVLLCCCSCPLSVVCPFRSLLSLFYTRLHTSHDKVNRRRATPFFFFSHPVCLLLGRCGPRLRKHSTLVVFSVFFFNLRPTQPSATMMMGYLHMIGSEEKMGITPDFAKAEQVRQRAPEKRVVCVM